MAANQNKYCRLHTRAILHGCHHKKICQILDIELCELHGFEKTSWSDDQKKSAISILHEPCKLAAACSPAGSSRVLQKRKCGAAHQYAGDLQSAMCVCRS